MELKEKIGVTIFSIVPFVIGVMLLPDGIRIFPAFPVLAILFIASCVCAIVCSIIIVVKVW